MKMVGHILRQDQNNNYNIAMTWTPEGKRTRGRPKIEKRKGQKRDGDRERK